MSPRNHRDPAVTDAFGNALGNSIVSNLSSAPAVETQLAERGEPGRAGLPIAEESFSNYDQISLDGLRAELENEWRISTGDLEAAFEGMDRALAVAQDPARQSAVASPEAAKSNTQRQAEISIAAAQRVNAEQQTEYQTSSGFEDSSSLEPNTRAATVVRGRDGRIYRHDTIADENGRFLFVKDPLTDPEVSMFSGELGINTALYDRSSRVTVPLADVGSAEGRFLQLRGTTGLTLEQTLNAEGLGIAGRASTNSELIYAGNTYDSPVGRVELDVRSDVDLFGEFRFGISRGGRSVDAGVRVGAYASGLQAKASFFSDEADLHFFNARVTGKGQLDALAAGGVLGTGLSARNGRVRVSVEAGAASLFGARGSLDLDIGPNENFTTNLLDGIDDFTSGRATLPEVVSRPSINPLAPIGAKLGEFLFNLRNR